VETVERRFTSKGQTIDILCQLPDEIAEAWLEYLGRSNLYEREIVEVNEFAQCFPGMRWLCLWRTSTNYYIILEPEED
jgi:hypothetical protein